MNKDTWRVPGPGEFRGRRDYSLHVPKIIDFDKRFHSQIDPPPVILNRFDFDTTGYADQLAEHVFSRAGAVDFVPQCSCRYYTGKYYENSICPKCHTPATDDMEASGGNLSHKTWISCPDEIPGWLHPDFYCLLHRWLSYGRRTRQNYTNALGDIANRGKERKGCYLDDILDVTTPIPTELAGAITGKGFKYLYDNFWYIIDFFSTVFKPTASNKAAARCRYLLQLYKDRIFCRYIPVQASSLHSIIVSEGSEDTRKKYVDRSCQYILAAASALSYLEHSTNKRRTHNEIEEATFEAYQNLIAYDYDISNKSMSKKRSLPRAHLFGSRKHMTMRGVIVPTTGPHQKDCIKAPWKSLVNRLRVPIVGRLMYDHGMSPAQAMRAHRIALQNYDPVIHEIILNMVRTSRDGCFYEVFLRNPAIHPASLQRMRIPEDGIKTNPDDVTFALSALACRGPNADRLSTVRLEWKHS